MPEWLSENFIWVVGGIVAFVVFEMLMLLLCYRKPSQGQAIIRSGLGGSFVSFSGKFVLPILHKAQYLDVTLKRLVIDRQGSEALICQGGIQADIKAAFFVRVNPTPTDVLKVVMKLGVEGAADIEKLSDLFVPRFLESVQMVAKAHTFEQLSDREDFKQQVMQTVGCDLDGYILDVVTIDYLEKHKQLN